MKKILIYLVALTQELQDYNDYYVFTDREKAEKFTKNQIAKAKAENGIFEIYTDTEFEFYFNSSRKNSQKIKLQKLKQRTEFLKFTQIQNLNFISIHLREIKKYILSRL
jgi:hypothetical protein